MSGFINNEAAVKNGKSIVLTLPRLIVLAIALIFVTTPMLILNARSVYLAERNVQAGSKQQKLHSWLDSFNQSLNVQMITPSFHHSNTTKEGYQYFNETTVEIDASINSTDISDNHRHNETNISNLSKNELKKGDRIVLELNDTYCYWGYTQSKFCQLIRHVTNVSVLGVDKPMHIRHNQSPTLLRSTFDCVAVATNRGLGTGNWITGFYAMRLVATLGMVDFEIQCQDGVKNDLYHLISWFTGYFPAPTEFQNWPFELPAIKEVIACDDRYFRVRLDKMARVIQSDLRKLAVTVLGSNPEIGWIHPSIPVNQPALVTGVELDDVTIHFRCGDILGGVNRNDFGIIHFSEYTKWIFNSSTSIGIVTQPYVKGKYTRAADLAKAGKCKRVVTALVAYLNETLPYTRISVHNDPEEPLAVTFARLVMSKQAFVSLSSFGMFPVVGTFGEGYFQRGNGGVNPWAIAVPEVLPNVHMMSAPRMGAGQIMRAGFPATLKWLLTPINETKRG